LPIGRRSFARLLGSVVLSIGCVCANQAQAQTLSIQGDRFAIDGVPRFLTFISFFNAMASPNIAQDFRALHRLGFDGVRIWPNLNSGGPQLMNRDGTLRSDGLTRLLSILDQARLERLVIDVTFTYEHISGMTPATARLGIEAATSALRSYDNLLFDIQNERNVGDRRFMSEPDVASIFNAIKAVHPSRIATASNSPADTPAYAAQFTARLGLDVTAYHEERHSDWFELGTYQAVVGTMRSNGRPAYLQEPNATRNRMYLANDRAEYFLRAIANAKLAGAAAWCFHTTVGIVDFRDASPFLEDRLRAFPEPEWAFVTSLNARAALRTNNGVNYVVPEGGGGGAVRADRTASGPGDWEVLGISAVSGGPLIAGEKVVLTASDGVHYLRAINGGGGPLSASSERIGPQEMFTIEKAGGNGAIHHGDSVGLRAGDSSWYVVALGGGGGSVTVTSTIRTGWETFTVLFMTPHSSEDSAESIRRADIRKP
jgi:hypothetical protein